MIGAALATIFISPITVTGIWHAVLLLPLCLAIAVVYKAVRCLDVKNIPSAAAVLWVTIICGMYAVGVGLWLLYRIWAG